MSNSYILATSGFILPDNPYFTSLPKEKVNDNSLLNKNTFITTDNSISDFIKSNDIHTSDIANTAYKRYMEEASFENFIELVNIASDILSKVNLSTFFNIQANNRNMSPLMFMVCIAVLNGSFVNEYTKYVSIPLNSRFTSENHLTGDAINKNLKSLEKYYAYQGWDSLIANLTTDRGAFTLFFKLLFVDTY